MNIISEINEFLSETIEKSGAFYLATVDGDQPTLRPLGFKMVVENKLYLGVGTFKSVFHQIETNPKLQLVAFHDGKWLRITAKAVIQNDPSLVEKCFEISPRLKPLYESNGWEMGIFSLENGTAQWIENAMQVVRTESF